MRAGRRVNTARIDQNAPTQDAIGGQVKAWSTYCATWPCELEQVKGGETYRGRIVHAAAEFVAVGAHVEGVTPRMRVVLGSRTFEILAANNVRNRNRELRLDLRERGL